MNNFNKEDSACGENAAKEEKANESAVKEKKKKEPKDRLTSFYDTVEILSVALVVVLLINLFVGRMTTVVGSSMYPTLHDSERLWISRLGYTPQNGDIVVVQEKNSAISEPIVKRVIATGGQTVEFDFENWKVYVDGELLEEDYINFEDWREMKSYGCEKKVTVPEGYIFVMGDNRNGSTDSRDPRVGFISEDDVMGKVILRIAPLNKFGTVN